MSFIESFELQDEIQNLQDVDQYEIPNEDKFTNEEPDELLEGMDYQSPMVSSILTRFLSCCGGCSRIKRFNKGTGCIRCL